MKDDDVVKAMERCTHARGEETSKVSLHKQLLSYMHTIMNISLYAFPYNGTRNACWHSLT
jgi:hypothetical protein